MKQEITATFYKRHSMRLDAEAIKDMVHEWVNEHSHIGFNDCKVTVNNDGTLTLSRDWQIDDPETKDDGPVNPDKFSTDYYPGNKVNIQYEEVNYTLAKNRDHGPWSLKRSGDDKIIDTFSSANTPAEAIGMAKKRIRGVDS